VEPTTELLLAHKHPDDRDAVADTLETVVKAGLPFSSRHRIIDTAGVMHHVLVVGDQLRDSVGALVGVLMPAEKLVVGSAAFGSADTRTRTRLDNLLLAVHAQP
jgi:hypothetical protein